MLTPKEVEEFNLALYKYYNNVLSSRFRELSGKITVSVDVDDEMVILLLESDVIRGAMSVGNGLTGLPKPEFMSSIWNFVTDALDGADLLLRDITYSGQIGYKVTEASRAIIRDLLANKRDDYKSSIIAAACALMVNVNGDLITKAGMDTISDMYHVIYDDNDYYISHDDIGLDQPWPDDLPLEDKVARCVYYTVSLTKSYNTPDRFKGGFLIGETSPLKQLQRDIYHNEINVMVRVSEYVTPVFTISIPEGTIH